ncbi:uncharacterized protein LOC130549068 [Triplophysa rosa]|uniref:SLAM family member 6 n=1 Tax=Triplophysa rosa TaxID=992332 RepID=A0A9W7WAJ2_TRIRA|nr:uncharacterized protein LOC130549068 [Triplophysa rosa]KAI7791028.1 putative SLAM family member 6 [Triplophysa rosa]
MDLCFVFLAYLTHFVVKGVFGVDPDEVKSVTEGHSVTLHTGVVKQRDDLIVWYYGPENTVVARINGKASSTMFSQDEMFRDRLKLNHQTGDLTITHITSHHSGLYTLRISSNNKVSYKTFNLTVNGPLPFLPLNPITNHAEDSESPDRRVIVITAVVVSVFGVITITTITTISVFMYRRAKALPGKSSESENCLTDEIRSINSCSTSEDEEASRCPNGKQHWIGAGLV